MSEDRRLQEAVLAELDWEPRVDAAHLGVAVVDGIVTLGGHVASLAERTAAEAAVRRVKGVRAIAGAIEIRLPEDRKHHDDEIAKRALAILAWHSPAIADRVSVKVAQGFVTLSGTVDRHYQRLQAEQDIRRLGGVVGVANRLMIRADTVPTDIEARVQAAFRRHAALDADGISVTREGGTVFLDGAVKSWHEHELAEQAAWAAPGVTAVDNRLIVEP